MFAPRLAACCVTLVLLLTAVRESRATRDAPPPAHTGGFGEASCQACHFEAEPNTGGGSVTLRGVPDRYTSGHSYDIEVVLTQRQIAAGGFQLTARFASDGTQAGVLVATPVDTQRIGTTTSAGIDYLHHVLDGTAPVANDTIRWRLTWTAPRAGAVIFHAAANAANDDSSPLGDMIYLAEQRSR